jgi:hypothetical protein
MPETVGAVPQLHVHGPEPEPEQELLHVPTREACTEVTVAEKFSVTLLTFKGVFESYVKYIEVIDGVGGVPIPEPACAVPLKLIAAVNA